VVVHISAAKTRQAPARPGPRSLWKISVEFFSMRDFRIVDKPPEGNVGEI
jgi:hypothetical protein